MKNKPWRVTDGRVYPVITYTMEEFEVIKQREQQESDNRKTRKKQCCHY